MKSGSNEGMEITDSAEMLRGLDLCPMSYSSSVKKVPTTCKGF